MSTHIIRTLPPTLSFDSKNVQSQFVGPVNSNMSVVSSQNGNSSSAFSFVVKPASGNTVSRCLELSMDLAFSLTAAAGMGAANGTVSRGNGNFGLRALPLTSIINTLSLSVNGVNVASYSPAQMADLCANMRSQDMVDSSPYCSQPDVLQQYNDIVANGANCNVLARWGTSRFSSDRAERIVYTNVKTLTTDLATNYAAVVNITEPLWIPGLDVLGQMNMADFANVDTITISGTFVSDLGRAFCYNPVLNALTAAPTVTVSGTPQLYYRESQLDRDVSPIPEVCLYEAPAYSLLVEPIADAVAANGTGSFGSQLHTPAVIPEKIYLWVRQKLAGKNYLTTDAFAQITSLTVQDGISNKFASFRAQDLFDMTKKNLGDSFQMSYQQWLTVTGSIVCLDCSADLSLARNEISGATVPKTLKFTVGYKNISTAAQNLELCILEVSDGLLKLIKGGQAQRTIGYSADEVAESLAGDVSRSAKSRDVLMGAGVLDFLKRYVVSPAVNVAKGVVDTARAVSDISSRLGYGHSTHPTGGAKKSGKGRLIGGGFE